jgi:hypothetical protein
VKKCSTCDLLKSESEFYKSKSKKDGLHSQCKACEAIKVHQRYLKTKDKAAENLKNWREKNRDRYNAWSRNWRATRKEKENAACRNYYQQNKAKIIERTVRNIKAQRMCNVRTRITHGFSTRMYQALKKRKNGHSWENIIGYTLKDLMSTLETKFQPGMTWKNYGRYGWHIDHIIPICRFNYTSFEDKEFKECWDLNNLQPLWATENLSKQN